MVANSLQLWDLCVRGSSQILPSVHVIVTLTEQKYFFVIGTTAAESPPSALSIRTPSAGSAKPTQWRQASVLNANGQTFSIAAEH
jgi:hypothetical protein